MFKLITPIILIAIAVTVFFTFLTPLYNDIGTLRSEVSGYDEALTNSKALESERDKLTAKYNSIGGENLERLAKLLPESVDNIRLILEIEKLAAPYGMNLKDVKYDATGAADAKAAVPGAEMPGGLLASAASKNYGIWNLEFSTQGNYDNFMNFLRDIERNLRIVDVTSVSFASNEGLGVGSNIYTYTFKIKTYWLKN